MSGACDVSPKGARRSQRPPRLQCTCSESFWRRAQRGVSVSIYGRPATDAERMQLHRDRAALAREGLVTLSQGEGRQRYVQPVESD
jgi:hypothetical protein